MTKTLSVVLGVLVACGCFLCLCSFCFYAFLIPIQKSTEIRNVNNAKTFSIKLERTACFGFCPIYSVEVDQDGYVTYTGEKFVNFQGKKQYKIDKYMAEKLFQDAIDADFFNLNDRYVDQRVTDLPSTVITITADGRTKSITMYGMEDFVPKRLRDLADKIDTVCETYQYVHTDDPTKLRFN